MNKQDIFEFFQFKIAKDKHKFEETQLGKTRPKPSIG